MAKLWNLFCPLMLTVPVLPTPSVISTVPVPGINWPLFAQLPETCTSPLVTIKDPEGPMMRLLAIKVPDITYKVPLTVTS